MHRMIYFNGINGESGRYQLDPMQLEDFAAVIRSRKLISPFRAVQLPPWIDPLQLSSAGWGVIYTEDCSAETMAALQALLELRREQATEPLFKELVYHPKETSEAFLRRHSVSMGTFDAEKVPYYLLIVGEPEEVPFELQYQLGTQYAVGRICFDSPEEYASYAATVIKSEQGRYQARRRAALWGPVNDPLTEKSVEHMVKPLARELRQRAPQWTLRYLVGADADKSALTRLVGGTEKPDILFTAGHALAFDNTSRRLRDHQGALLCSGWPDPQSPSEPPSCDHYFTAEDLGCDAEPGGMISFHFACFSAGTPLLDSVEQGPGCTPTQLAPKPFVARLPQRMLGHPRGGALAVIGHVNYAWPHSFLWANLENQVGAFSATLVELMKGKPVGLSMMHFDQRYLILASELHAMRDQGYWQGSDEECQALIWTACQDAQSYIILGDPFVRLRTTS